MKTREQRLLYHRQWRLKNAESIRRKNKAKYKALKNNPALYAKKLQRQRAAYAVGAKRPWGWCLGHTRNRAKRKGLLFELDNEWFAEQWVRGCALTGLPFRRGSGKVSVFSCSVDKIVPTLGYTKSNSRLVLFSVNALKLNGSDLEMYQIAEALIRRRDGAKQISRLSPEAARLIAKLGLKGDLPQIEAEGQRVGGGGVDGDGEPPVS